MLDSFYKSGELEINNNQTGIFARYKLTGKALATLETYEIESRHHNRIENLTCALVLVGIIQAILGLVQTYIAYLKPYLIKIFPTLF